MVSTPAVGVAVSDKKYAAGETATGGKGGERAARKPPSQAVNVLDSTAPTVRRGIERETAKKKRPTKLKKAILAGKLEAAASIEGHAVSSAIEYIVERAWSEIAQRHGMYCVGGRRGRTCIFCYCIGISVCNLLMHCPTYRRRVGHRSQCHRQTGKFTWCYDYDDGGRLLCGKRRS